MNWASQFYALCIHLLRHPRGSFQGYRPTGTPARNRNPKPDGLRLAVVRGRLEFADKVKLVGGKGMR